MAIVVIRQRSGVTTNQKILRELEGKAEKPLQLGPEMPSKRDNYIIDGIE